jgi:hypothetical protein
LKSTGGRPSTLDALSTRREMFTPWLSILCSLSKAPKPLKWNEHRYGHREVTSAFLIQILLSLVFCSHHFSILSISS